MHHEYLIVAFGFIIFDIVTGLLKAFYNKNFNSTVMRQGGFHKIAEVVVIIGTYLLELANVRLNLGFNIPALGAVTVYLCGIEGLSIVENLAEINPEMNKLYKYLSPYLEKLQNKIEVDDNGSNK